VAEVSGLQQDEAASGHLPPHFGSSLTPAQAATCDSKYWACPGANNLKVRLLQ